MPHPGLRPIVLLLISAAFTQLMAQTTPPAVVQMTAPQDHQRMMNLLGIKELRPGADGSHPDSPHAANYDEAKANPYPSLPDPLVLKNGKRVKSAKVWWNQRRAEILEDFDKGDILAALTVPENASGRVPVIMELGFIGGFPRRPGAPPPPPPVGPTWKQQLLAEGWGYLVLSPNSIQADNGAGLTQGIIG